MLKYLTQSRLLLEWGKKMSRINLLDELTIDKIAAGEVIERPASVVKELVENAIDGDANAITIEIKEGGIGFIRITDNGCGIDAEDVPTAFLRHATSKINGVKDLLSIRSLGFRGEALSSIAAVSQVELITKTPSALTGVRYQIAGGKEVSLEHIGCPEGTTFIVRNLFFNVPARKKFLKTPQTEGAHIFELVQQLALSHPDISFQFIMNGKNRFYSSGNGNLKDIIYTIYGKEVAQGLLPVSLTSQELELKIHGFIGKPIISRGNRSYENYYINKRYVKSKIIYRAIEDAYKTFTMVHKFPFVCLFLDMQPEQMDINVHPTKMDIRFHQEQQLYYFLKDEIRTVLFHKDLIPDVSLSNEKKPKSEITSAPIIQPFEKKRRMQEADRTSSSISSMPAIEINFEKTDSGNQKPIQTSVIDANFEGKKLGSDVTKDSGKNSMKFDTVSKPLTDNANVKLKSSYDGNIEHKTNSNINIETKPSYNGSAIFKTDNNKNTKSEPSCDGGTEFRLDNKKNIESTQNCDGGAELKQNSNISTESNYNGNAQFKPDNNINTVRTQNCDDDAILKQNSNINTEPKGRDGNTDSNYASNTNTVTKQNSVSYAQLSHENKIKNHLVQEEPAGNFQMNQKLYKDSQPEQMSFLDASFIKDKDYAKYQIIGQLFKTYWLIEYDKKLFIMDQHAAHEKVNYERFMKHMKDKKNKYVQQLSPAIVITLSPKEAVVYEEYKEFFADFGFEIESYGGTEYCIQGVPTDLYGIADKDAFVKLLDEISENVHGTDTSMIADKIATMACKASVKGNQRLSVAEAQALINELMTLDSPFTCPHGRPTIISMTQTEIEKKFKRIQN